jgi:hypothetical protein
MHDCGVCQDVPDDIRIVEYIKGERGSTECSLCQTHHRLRHDARYPV